MVALDCPLCCHETFDSALSLKCHIVGILENLSCPMCNEKFEKLSELVEHLDSNCLEETVSVETEGSILAKALLGSPRSEDTQYHCQMCDVHFDDIDSHLSMFHPGQEIVMEEEPETPVEPTEEAESALVIINSTDSDPPEMSFVVAPTKKLNTITQQDIKDKDGRLYTRKFVKIDKFWLENDEDKQEPESFIQSYVISDNVVKKVTEDDTIEVNKCPICGLYVSELEMSHKCDKKSHVCDECNTTFPTFKSLRLHRRMHEPIKTREIEAPANYENGEESVRQMFVCKICNKSYDKEYEQVHLSSHDFNNGYNCDVCNRRFYTQANLDMHMKAHSSNKKFSCSYCKKPFVTYDALSDHLLNQCQKRPYACQYCGRRFARPHEKVKHERIHTGEKPHVCDICGKAFRVSYCLTLHLRTHSGTRPYQCKHCLKRFKSHSVYNHHMLTHSDVRAYKCPYCPKAFKTSVQLAGHKNSHIKPFTCTECNRPFASLYAVRAHMATHKRDNNLKYECWMCGALYSRAFALRDHLKQQHQQDGGKDGGEAVLVEEEIEATNSILVGEDDIIYRLDGAANIQIIETGAE